MSPTVARITTCCMMHSSAASKIMWGSGGLGAQAADLQCTASQNTAAKKRSGPQDSSLDVTLSTTILNEGTGATGKPGDRPSISILGPGAVDPRHGYTPRLYEIIGGLSYTWNFSPHTLASLCGPVTCCRGHNCVASIGVRWCEKCSDHCELIGRFDQAACGICSA